MSVSIPSAPLSPSSPSRRTTTSRPPGRLAAPPRGSCGDTCCRTSCRPSSSSSRLPPIARQHTSSVSDRETAETSLAAWQACGCVAGGAGARDSDLWYAEVEWRIAHDRAGSAEPCGNRRGATIRSVSGRRGKTGQDLPNLAETDEARERERQARQAAEMRLAQEAAARDAAQARVAELEALLRRERGSDSPH